MLIKVRWNTTFFQIISASTLHYYPYKFQKQCELCHDPFIAMTGHEKYCGACVEKFNIHVKKEEIKA